MKLNQFGYAVLFPLGKDARVQKVNFDSKIEDENIFLIEAIFGEDTAYLVYEYTLSAHEKAASISRARLIGILSEVDGTLSGDPINGLHIPLTQLGGLPSPNCAWKLPGSLSFSDSSSSYKWQHGTETTRISLYPGASKGDRENRFTQSLPAFLIMAQALLTIELNYFAIASTKEQ